MARRGVLTKITKDYILNHVNQESIFAVYFGISESDIIALTGTNRKISAPYREDNDPSLGFTYRANGKLSAKDFGGYFWGDCFDCVGFVLGLNPNIKSDFGKIMEDIAKTFGIHKYQDANNTVVHKKLNIQIKEKPKLRIQVATRSWINLDGHYWFTKYGITREILKRYNVFPISYLYFNGQCVYEYDPYDLGYAYFLGKKNGIDYWKCYFPFRKENKWFSNGGVVQGITQMKPSEMGVITKALKDVMCLASINVQAIAPASETTRFTQQQLNYIKSKWKFTISLMDFDKAGRDMARELRRNDIPSLFLTNGDFDTFDFGSKDISDYHNDYGRNQLLQLKDSIIANDFEFTQNFANLLTQLKHK